MPISRIRPKLMPSRNTRLSVTAAISLLLALGTALFSYLLYTVAHRLV